MEKSFLVYGSQIVHAYSSIGITKDLQHDSLICRGQDFKFLRKKPKTELAFFEITEMCSDQFKDSLMVIPRYLADETCFMAVLSML